MRTILGHVRILSALFVGGLLLAAIPVATASAARCPSNPNYVAMDFSGQNLAQCNFAGFHFGVGTSFANANLAQANFSGDSLGYIDFSGANLSLANLSNTTASCGTTLDRVIARGAIVTTAHWDFICTSSSSGTPGPDFSGANFTYTNIDYASLTNWKLVGATVTGTTTCNTSFTNVTQTGEKGGGPLTPSTC